MNEIWKTFRDGFYEVSNLGNIRRVKGGKGAVAGKNLKPGLADTGYLVFAFCKDGKQKSMYVHKVVAEVFLGDCPKDYQVNHIDGNKTNNNATNLEYVTKSRNLLHAIETGLRTYDDAGIKLDLEKAEAIRRLAKNGMPQSQIAKTFGIDQSSVSKIINNRHWRKSA